MQVGEEAQMVTFDSKKPGLVMNVERKRYESNKVCQGDKTVAA